MLPVPSRGCKQLTGAASRAAGLPVAGVLALIARLRGGKAVHPHGVSYSAEFCIDGSRAASRPLIDLLTDHSLSLVKAAKERVISEHPHWREAPPNFDGGARETTPDTSGPSFGKAIKERDARLGVSGGDSRASST